MPRKFRIDITKAAEADVAEIGEYIAQDKPRGEREGRMQIIQRDKDDILRAIREKQSELAHRFSVRRIGVFGFFVRDSAGPESDVDVPIELAEPTFDPYMDLKFYLEEVLNRSVDLVMADAVKPRLKPIIEKDVVSALAPSSLFGRHPGSDREYSGVRKRNPL